MIIRKKLLSCFFLIPTILCAINSYDSYRQDALISFIQKFKRPTTVAIIDDMYPCACAIAAYNAVPILITPDCNNTILARCIAQQSPILLIKKQPSLAELEIVGDCEHLDIVCAFSSVEQYGYLWQKAVRYLIRLGDYTFLETKTAEQAEFIQPFEPLLINTYENRTLWLIHKEKKYLTRRSWFYGAPNHRMYQIESNFYQKYFIKDKGIITKIPWIAGINLQTFKELNGVYPTNNMIREQIKSLKSIAHNDMAIFNIIINNKRLVPIDCDEAGRTRWLRFALWTVLKEFKN